MINCILFHDIGTIEHAPQGRLDDQLMHATEQKQLYDFTSLSL